MSSFGQNPFGSTPFGAIPIVNPCFTQPDIFDSATFQSCIWDGKVLDKNDLLDYIRRYLNDPTTGPNGGRFWSNLLLKQLIGQAESEISTQLNAVWIKFALSIKAGTGVYTLPYNIRRVTRVTIPPSGISLYPLSQSEMVKLAPTYRYGLQSLPRWYSIQFDGMFVMRFLPIPTVSVVADNTNIYNDTGIRTQYVVSAFILLSETENSLSIPSYYARLLIKEYVLARAYLEDGPMKNQGLSKYHQKKYEMRLEKYKKIHQSAFSSKTRELADIAVQRPFRRHHPILPPNFGVTVGPPF